MSLEKRDIEHLAALSRMEIAEEEKEKILHDLKGILGYVEKLKKVNTEGVEPMTGGTRNTNESRSDDGGELVATPAEELTRAFPEAQDAYLKVPYVFE